MRSKELTPLEALIVRDFQSRGGVIDTDADGDVYVRIDGQRLSIEQPFGAGPFLVFGQQSMRRGEFHFIRRALKKAARS